MEVCFSVNIFPSKFISSIKAWKSDQRYQIRRKGFVFHATKRELMSMNCLYLASTNMAAMATSKVPFEAESLV
jgi:hypothetical protein